MSYHFGGHFEEHVLGGLDAHGVSFNADAVILLRVWGDDDGCASLSLDAAHCSTGISKG